MENTNSVFRTVYELEMSVHFDDLVKYANTEASNIEKALIYINLVEVFSKILEIEFENKTRIKGQEIKKGFNRWKENQKTSKLAKKLIEKDFSDIAGWDEIASKLEQYRPYRNDFVHNLLINKTCKRVRTIEEINYIIFMTGELAEEIYNLIIGAREYLESEYDDHVKNPEF